MIAAVANAGSSGHDAHAVVGAEVPHRIGGFVEERLRERVERHVTTAPMRKPSRIPFFTQAFTRQPVCAEASGSAARICPAFRACLNRAKSSKCSSV